MFPGSEGKVTTEPEAVMLIHDQLASNQGFIARLQGGEGLDKAAVQQVYEALDVLKTQWAGLTCVPKAPVLPMVDVSTRLLDCAHLYPDLERDIQNVAFDLVERIEQVFRPPYPRMTEDQAMAVTYVHLLGIPSLSLDLHHRQNPTTETLDELQTAFETLAQAWVDRECVPKTIIGPMLDVRELIRGHAGWHPQSQARLEAYADNLAELVRRCLS